jgi:hypothetical protein
MLVGWGGCIGADPQQPQWAVVRLGGNKPGRLRRAMPGKQPVHLPPVYCFHAMSTQHPSFYQTPFSDSCLPLPASHAIPLPGLLRSVNVVSSDACLYGEYFALALAARKVAEGQRQRVSALPAC